MHGSTHHPQPVYLELTRACAFKKRPNDPSTGKKRMGCDRCGMPKGHRDHMGQPPSFNPIVSGQGSGNAMVYQGQKKLWQSALTDLLQESGLPRGLTRVMAEGEAVFPDRRRRDQGNFRVMLEKALGDALVSGFGEVPGGWLPDDSWDHFEFGNLTYVHRPRVSATRLTILPG